MRSRENAVLVFTGESVDNVIAAHGSQSWKLDAGRAKKCEWLVCTQNARNYEDYADGVAPHGAAFLIGRISRIVPATDPGNEGRWLIEISEYARLKQPQVWTGDRNPVRYISFDTLGIDLDSLEFQKLERHTSEASAVEHAATGLTIAQAKAGLARTYGVSVDSIEIVIRG